MQNSLQNSRTLCLIGATAMVQVLAAPGFAASAQRPVPRPARVEVLGQAPLQNPEIAIGLDQAKPNAWARAKRAQIAAYRRVGAMPIPELHPAAFVVGKLARPATSDVKPSVDFQTRVMPPEFDLGRYERVSFKSDRSKLLKMIGRSGRGGTPTEIMDLAEFYLAHVMIPEGRSILSALPPNKMLSAKHRARKNALSVAFLVMSGQDVTANGFDNPLVPGFEKWPDYQLWLALSEIQSGNDAGIKRHLNGAYQRLANYPGPFVEVNLPVMLEAAIQTDQMVLAKDIVERFDHVSALKNSSAHRFLIGLAAERSGQAEKAFSAYAQAAKGWDLYAQRARLAIVDMGLASGALPDEDARRMLEVNRGAWRGDKYELQSLIRLATINVDLNDSPAALDVLGDVITLFPQSDEAALARTYAKDLLQTYYMQGRAGQVSLSEFVRTHRMIQSEYRFFAGFERQSELFADTLLALGATSVAAEEYRTIQDYLRVARELDLWPTDKETFLRLQVKQAEALARGGQYARAGAVLARIDIREMDGLRDQFNNLQAWVFAEVGNQDRVLAMAITQPGSAHLRLLAEAYWSKADWAAAAQKYSQLWRAYPEAFTFSDAINLLLSSYRSGDFETTMKVAKEVPDLTDSSQWSEIASGLLYNPASLTELNSKSARQRVLSAAETIERLRQVAER